jgi:hypothetical protein
MRQTQVRGLLPVGRLALCVPLMVEEGRVGRLEVEAGAGQIIAGARFGDGRRAVGTPLTRHGVDVESWSVGQGRRLALIPGQLLPPGPQVQPSPGSTQVR